jgi:phosphoribosyl 1,2-cyclic phosphate phosphodiesterase
MEILMLGSGGVSPMPRPTCVCRVCKEARDKGIPYARTGPSLFIKDINLLFDTPEEIRQQLNREKITRVDSIILTHWHPDHTHGLRVIEQINYNFDTRGNYFPPINVYISKKQRSLFKKMTCGSFLDFYERKNMIKVIELKDKEPIVINNITITPNIIKKTDGFYFLIRQKEKKVIYAPCEYHFFKPNPEIKKVDLFIVHNLFWENKDFSPRKNHPLDEDSFEEMLDHAKAFEAKRIILTHIEESFGLGHDELNKRLKYYYPEYNIIAGYDGLKVIFRN